MDTKQCIVAGLAITLAFVVVALLTPRTEWGSMAGIIALAGLLIAPLFIRRVRIFIRLHSRGVVVAGVVITLAGIALPFVLLSSAVNVSLVVGSMVVIMMGGLALCMIPSSLNRFEAQQAVAKEPCSRATGGFHPVAEARAAVALLASNRGALMRVVGPWILVACVCPLVMIVLNKASPSNNKGLALLVLLGLLGLLLAACLAILIALIQWVRFIGEHREPAMTAIPAKALWSWSWRLFVFGSATRFVDASELWLKSHWPAASAWQVDGAQILIWVIVCLGAAPIALVLPPLALGAVDKSIARALRGYQFAGRKFFAGIALILMPYALLSWVLGIAAQHYQHPLVLAVSVVVSFVVLLATLLIGLTYLTRIYQRMEPTPPTPSAA